MLTSGSTPGLKEASSGRQIKLAHPAQKLLHMRVVTLQDALEDVGRNPRPFIIINRERRHPDDIPLPNKLLLERLREDCAGDLLIVPTTLAELDAKLPPLSGS